MGGESQYQYARVSNANVVDEVVPQYIQGLAQHGRLDGVTDGAQGQVRGDQSYAQLASCQHHHYAFGAGFFCQVLGMAAKGDTGFVDHRFVNRCGYHGLEMTLLAAFDSEIQCTQYISTVVWI